MRPLPQLMIAANEEAAQEQRVCMCAGRSTKLSTGQTPVRDALTDALRAQDAAWKEFDWSYGRSVSPRDQAGSVPAASTTTMKALPM